MERYPSAERKIQISCGRTQSISLHDGSQTAELLATTPSHSVRREAEIYSWSEVIVEKKDEKRCGVFGKEDVEETFISS